MSKKDESKKIALMAGGIAIAVPFAIWNINRSLSPAPSEPVQKETKETKKDAVTEMEEEVKSDTVATSANATPVSAVSGIENGEADLAADANPFAAVAWTAPNADPASAPKATQGGIPPAATGNMPPNVPILPAVPGGMNGSLPPVTFASNSLPTLPTKPEAEVKAEPPPTLIGTLLGDRPSAVFQADKHLAIVPAGETYHTWKVLAVSHGSVVIKNTAGRKLRIEVGTITAIGSARATSVPTPRYADANHQPIDVKSIIVSADSQPTEQLDNAATSPKAVLPEEQPDGTTLSEAGDSPEAR